MTRLSPSLGAPQRRDLSIVLALRSVAAASDAGLRVTVLTADDAVSLWAADIGVSVARDRGDDLSEAVAHHVATLDLEPWLVLHADLPAVDGAAIKRVADASERAMTALAPSLDGGTNVIASAGPFPFAYGPGSFHRHLAARPTAEIVVDRRLALEVDTPDHVRTLGTLGLLPSLTS